MATSVEVPLSIIGFLYPEYQGLFFHVRRARRAKNNVGDPGAVSRVDEMSVVKVYCKIETSPGALYSYRTSSRSV